jgi:hypothetical protein
MTPEEQTISEILSLDGGERFKVVNVLIKNRAIAFAKWIRTNGWEGSGTETYVNLLQAGWPVATTEELYTLFLNQSK